MHRPVYVPRGNEDSSPIGANTRILQLGTLSDPTRARISPNVSESRTVVLADNKLIKKRCRYLIRAKDGLKVASHRTSIMFMVAYNVGRFYTPDENKDLNLQDLIMFTCGIVAATSNVGNDNPWNEMVSAAREADIDFKLKGYTEDELSKKTLTDIAFRRLRAVFGESIAEKLRDTYMIFIIGILILMAIGKNINPQYYAKWAERRIRALCSAAGATELISELPVDRLPSASVMAKLSNVLSASHPVRKELFLTISCLARENQRNTYGKLYNELIQCLQFTEMRHIVTIEKYIFGQYPELAGTKLLAGLPHAFASAVTFIESFKEDDKPFIKLIRDKNETAALNGSNFRKAIIVAKTIAGRDQDSYRNYGEEELGESALAIKAATMKYIEQRERAALIGAVEASRAPLVEGQALLDKFLDDFNKQLSTSETAPSTVLRSAHIKID